MGMGTDEDYPGGPEDIPTPAFQIGIHKPDMRRSADDVGTAQGRYEI